MTNNPPAFPVVPDERELDSVRNGMTLRDYFAAKAMQGLLSTAHFGEWSTVAEDAYKAAEAMLKARES